MSPTVVVVGGGTGGLMMAMRLRDIGIRVLVVEKNKAVADTWRNRYDLLTLNVSFRSFPRLRLINCTDPEQSAYP